MSALSQEKAFNKRKIRGQIASVSNETGAECLTSKAQRSNAETENVINSELKAERTSKVMKV